MFLWALFLVMEAHRAGWLQRGCNMHSEMRCCCHPVAPIDCLPRPDCSLRWATGRSALRSWMGSCAPSAPSMPPSCSTCASSRLCSWSSCRAGWRRRVGWDVGAVLRWGWAAASCGSRVGCRTCKWLAQNAAAVMGAVGPARGQPSVLLTAVQVVSRKDGVIGTLQQQLAEARAQLCELEKLLA